MELEDPTLFGVPLEEAAFRSSSLIPLPLTQAITFLNAKGLDEEGLYRVPGCHEDIQKYKARFNKGEKVDFFKEDERLPENVAGVVVRFLKEIPHSILICSEVYEKFKAVLVELDFENIKAEQKDDVRKLIEQLPAENRETIHLLAAHFQLVYEHRKTNKMDFYALQTTLAIMFGQTIARLMMLLVMDLSLCPSTVVFGVPLDVALKRVINPTNPYVPLVLETCFNFIENKRYEDDLYVSRGSWLATQKLALQIDSGDYKLSDCTDVDVITSLVRLYIHDLPHSLFTDQFKSDFAAIEGAPDAKQLRKIIDKMPKDHYETLKRLATHIHKVIEHSNGNLKPFQFGHIFGGWHQLVLQSILENVKALYDL